MVIKIPAFETFEKVNIYIGSPPLNPVCAAVSTVRPAM
jgi:hypothetical protein